MKLNLNCMRDILLTLEQFDYGQIIHHKDLEKRLSSNYSEADVYYSVLKLAEADFIKADYFDVPGGVPQISLIYDITYAGHEFLNSVRPASVWQKLIPTLQNAGISSLKIAAKVGYQLALDKITQTLPL